MATAHLIHGFIGSGKTTFAKALASATPACIRFTHDEWMHRLYGSSPPETQFSDLYNRVHALIWDLALDVLSTNCSVVIDSGYWTAKSRTRARKQLESNGHLVQLYSVQCDLDTMKNRTLERSNSIPTDSLWIDAPAFEKLYKRFEPLAQNEAALVIDGAADPVGELARIQLP